MLMGPKRAGEGGEEARSELGIQSLKENISQALGFQILTMKMKVNMVIFPLNFEILRTRLETMKCKPLFSAQHIQKPQQTLGYYIYL